MCEGAVPLQRGSDLTTRRTDASCLLRNRDDWLDEIPSEWPTPNARSQQLEQQELTE